MSRILVVDDSSDIRLLLRKTLQNAGHEVAVATDGDEVQPAILSNEPDLVLMDVAMPRVDGFAALTKLKQDQRTRHIPVIMVTAKGHPDDLDVARALGAEDYVNKPWAPGEVELRVQWVITAAERRRARIEEKSGLRRVG